MDEVTILVPSTTSASCRHSQRENIPVPLPLELASLPLPEPLRDAEDDQDIEPEVENQDDPHDLLPDEESLLEPDMDPEPEPEPLPTAEFDPDDALPDLEFCDVAGKSLWTHTPSASSVLVPRM